MSPKAPAFPVVDVECYDPEQFIFGCQSIGEAYGTWYTVIMYR